MRSKYVCITVNNYTDFHVIYYQSLVARGLATYVIFGRELGENGTRHLQGYVEFSDRLRTNQLRNVLPGAHIEARRGNADQARDYCVKDGDFEEFGSISVSRQGVRTDLAQLYESIRNGKRKADLCTEHFAAFIKYQRGIDAARLALSRKRNLDNPPSVIVYWGRTGTGKTRAVWSNAESDSIFVYPGNGWFDGYEQHPIALFDDFNGGEFKISYLLKVLDRYPIKVPIKGGFVEWCPEEIYLTSNLAPECWFPNANTEHVNALLRRFTNVVHFE